MNAKWTARDVPNLKGRTAVVTGASSGIGYEVALQLATHGAHVVLAGRDRRRVEEAARRVEVAAPGASVAVQLLDLADLDSVRRCADDFIKRNEGLDILVNNAGVAGGPRRLTADGLEAHFQINYLGHFALTCLLQLALRARAGARVVTVSSDVAARGRIDFDDLQSKNHYSWIAAYAQSKLAALLFAFELDRRSRAIAISSLAAHPGAVNTNLLVGKDADWGRSRRGTEHLIRAIQIVLGRSTQAGALPILYQATAPLATSADYIGPGGKSGYPTVSKAPRAAFDEAVARRLWEISEELSGIRYRADPSANPRIREVG